MDKSKNEEKKHHLDGDIRRRAVHRRRCKS